MKRIMMAALGALVALPAFAEDKQVTIASWGGSYQEAQDKALFGPGEEKTGIKVNQETYGGMSDVRLQVQTGNVTLDIVSSGSGSAARAAAEGLLESLDYDIIDVSDFYPTLYTDTCVGSDVFSTVYAWNTETYGEDGPQSWADFWDVEKFPGKRAYRGKVAGALEPALMADGVPPEDVYQVLDSEEGIERAIDKIRELKPHIDVFWTSGAQHAQLMKDGEVDMTTGWNGRSTWRKRTAPRWPIPLTRRCSTTTASPFRRARLTRTRRWSSWPRSPRRNCRRTCRCTSPMDRPTRRPMTSVSSTKTWRAPCPRTRTMRRCRSRSAWSGTRNGKPRRRRCTRKC